MLDYAQQHAAEVLGNPPMAVLVTNGPAGVQVGEFPCAVMGLSVYLLVPQTSDHLFNLEQESAVTLLITSCELKGTARPLDYNDVPPTCALLQHPVVQWGTFLRVEISRVQLRSADGWGNRETLDL